MLVDGVDVLPDLLDERPPSSWRRPDCRWTSCAGWASCRPTTCGTSTRTTRWSPSRGPRRPGPQRSPRSSGAARPVRRPGAGREAGAARAARRRLLLRGRGRAGAPRWWPTGATCRWSTSATTAPCRSSTTSAVIEVPARVGSTGVTAAPVEPLAPLFAGLVAHVSAYEELALDAAVHGGRDRVYRALLAHPLIGQHDVADPADRPAARRQPRPPGVAVMTRCRARRRRRQQQDRRGPDRHRRHACSGSAGARAPATRASGSRRRCGVLAELVAGAAAEAGLDPAGPVAGHGAFYLAGADLPVEVAMLREAAHRHGLGHRRRGRQRHLRPAPGGHRVAGRGRRGLRRGHQLRGRLGGGRSGPLPVPGAGLRRLGWRRAAGQRGALAGRPRRGRPRPRRPR